MALLKIIKLSTKTWKHNSDVDGDFILTKFYAKQEDNDFLLVESYGAKRRKYKINEIEVYDIGGSSETFADFDALFLRLEVLKYPAFYVDGEFTFNPASYDLSEFQNAEADKFVKESEVLSNDISTYAPATTPLNPIDKAVVFQSGVPKEVAVSEFGKKIYNNSFKYPSWWTSDKLPVSINSNYATYDYRIEDFFDIESLTPFYVSPTGSNSNNGLSKSTPKASISSCLTAGAKLIYMLPGVYYRDNFVPANCNLSGNDLIIIGIGSVYVTQAQKSLTFTLTSNNTYTAVRSSVTSVIDKKYSNDYGYFKELKYVTSQALCEAEAGTYFVNATNVFVHLEDNRVPDDNVIVGVNIGTNILSDSGRFYLKNVILSHCNFTVSGTSISSTLEVYFENVINPYSEDILTTVNGFYFDKFKKCVVKKCKSINSRRDGFNYHNSLNALNVSVYELECESFNSGINDLNPNNQCSTAHEGISIIRLNGNYYGGNTQTIADVNSGTKSILIGCELNTGNLQTNTHIYWGVNSKITGCRLYGNKLINCEIGGEVTIDNSIIEISGTTGNVIID